MEPAELKRLIDERQLLCSLQPAARVHSSHPAALPRPKPQTLQRCPGRRVAAAAGEAAPRCHERAPLRAQHPGTGPHLAIVEAAAQVPHHMCAV